MKIVLFLFTTVLTITNYPNYNIVNEIILDDKHKVESTFSGNTNDENTFHLIIAKNSDSKDYDVIPYLYQNDEIIQLKTVSFEKLPSILSFHNQQDKLSLITQSKVGKSEMITVVDVDLSTGEHIKSEAIETEDFKTLIRKKDKNLIVFSNKESITILEVKGAESIHTTTASPDKTSTDFLNSLSKNSLDAINNDEFVSNGSINTFRAYNDGNAVIITEENTKEATTNMVEIPLNKGAEISVGSKTYGGKSKDSKIEKSTSYINNDKLYQLKLGKEEAKLDVYGFSDASKTTLDVLGIKPSMKGNGFKDTNDFVKNAAKNSNEPTVTINNTKDGKLKVRFDFVNKNAYRYQYNWWWNHQWHMQQMHLMMHQQNVRNSMPKFGPSEPDEYFFVKEEKSFFEIILDTADNVLDDVTSESEYKNIDKKSYIKVLDEDKKLKHTSTVFTDSKFRYLTYDKRVKSYKIIEKVL